MKKIANAIESLNKYINYKVQQNRGELMPNKVDVLKLIEIPKESEYKRLFHEGKRRKK